MDKNMRILVVDDSAAMRRIIIAALRDEGFKKYIEAGDGDLAWDILQSKSVDLVLCDHNMPNMTGTDLLVKVREKAEFMTLPFIMITAEADRDNVLTAVKAGVSNYIVKPFSSDLLKKKIVETLERQSLHP